jgi:porin
MFAKKSAAAVTAAAAGSLLLATGTAQAQSTTDWSPVRWLENYGITPIVTYTGEAAANPTGGIRQGQDYAGQVQFGADFNLDKLINLPGGTIHFAMTNRHGRNLASDYIGNNTSVQEIFGTQNTHLAQLTYEQTFLDGRIDAEVGRTVANIAFLNSDIYCNFQSNAACGNPTYVFKTSNFTFWPASSWGGHVKGWMTDKIFAHVGAYEVNPNRKTIGDNGFNFSTTGATGAILPYEVGYSTTFANDRLPRNYILGGWYDASNYSDPLLDTHGGTALVTGDPAATRRGRSGVYFRFDQMIWRPDPSSHRGLTVFGVAMTGTSGRLTEDAFFEAGLLQRGTFAGRDDDTLGFMVSDQIFSNLALDTVRAARQSVGINTSVPRHQIMMELAYGMQLTPSIRLSPNLQYIVNPDTMSEPFRPKNTPDALVVGFKFSVDLVGLGVHGGIL